MSGLWQDVTYAVRSLGRHPGFALVALTALGITIGLNSSVFTVYSAVALRPWRVADPDHVVKIFRLRAGGADGFSIAHYRHLSQHAKSFEGIAAMSWYESDQLSGGRVKAQYVSGNYFRVLGVRMHRGRGFADDEDDAGRPQAVAVLTHAAWQRFFQGDPAVLGRSVQLRHASFTIIGIAEEGFTGTEIDPRDMFVPLASRRLVRSDDGSAVKFLTHADVCCTTIAGRLAAGVSRSEARAELDHLSRQFQAPLGREADPVLVTGTAILETPHMAWLSSALRLMFAGVSLALLLACANVANLLLARAAARRHEIAVRLALGASRGRVVRQLLTEGLVLATAASALGIGMAFVLPERAVGIMFSVSPATLATYALQPDARALGFTVAVAVAACLVFALAPALHCTRGSVSAALKNRADRLVRRVSLRGTLLATQVAISVMLLAAAGLLVRGITHARGQELGFTTKDVTLVTFSVPARYEGSRARPLRQRLHDDLAALPGSPRFAFTSRYPLEDEHVGTTFRLPGETEGKSVRYEEVSAGYFDVLGIGVVRGRNFVPADEGGDVILVNEKLAERYWPGAEPIGQSVVLDRDAPRLVRVVGVVRNAHTRGLGAVTPAFYRPTGHARPAAYDEPFPYVLVEDVGHGTVTAAAMTAIARRLDRQAAVELEPLTAAVDRWFKPATVGAALASVVGLLTLALAAMGMAGVFAYAVQQRTREIGIRMALGARAAHILRLVLGSSSRAILAGLAAGSIGAVAASQVLRSRLFGLSPFDPLAYAAVLVILLAAGLIATYVPARRATRVEPTVALRYE